LSYEDKSFYLASRSPVSAACLRHYRVAPTYCEQYVFQWQPGRYPGSLATLARPLERNGLSVFAPRQQWTLQGEFVLPTVRVSQAANSPGTFWTPNPAGSSLIGRLAWARERLWAWLSNGGPPAAYRRLPWWHHKHLDLNMPAHASVAWTVHVPSQVALAEFRSAVAIRSISPDIPTTTGMGLEVSVQREGDAAAKVVASEFVPAGSRQWTPVRILLTDYAGQTITLGLSALGEAAGAPEWGVFRYPTIYLTLPPGAPAVPEESVRPSNTDLAPYAPQPTEADFRFNLLETDMWMLSGIAPAPGVPGSWVVSEAPFLDYNGPLNACAADYSAIYFEVAVPPEILPRQALVYYRLNGDASSWNRLGVPLLADGDLHAYTYELKLLELNPRDRLTDIRLDPPGSVSQPAQSLVRMADFRLIRGDQLGACSG
jgi:hypothetical protein